MPAPLQPFVHELATTIAAPSVTLSAADGQIEAVGAQGFFLGDRRMLSRFAVLGFGKRPEVLRSDHDPSGTFEVVLVLRDGGEPTPDPTVILSRRRSQRPTGFIEEWTLTNHALAPRRIVLDLLTASDFATTTEVKSGRPASAAAPAAVAGAGVLTYSHGRGAVAVRASGSPTIDADSGRMTWTVDVDRTTGVTIGIEVTAQNGEAPFRAAARPVLQPPGVTTSDPRLADLVAWSFADLAALALSETEGSDDTFIGAGSPWYLTLFGRDSLWAARLLLPFTTGPAMATLRVLARRQGNRLDAVSAEQPGRIPHEARSDAVDTGGALLPPLYYGSIDATLLWMTTLAEAHRWGIDDDDALAALVPALEAASGWLLEASDADGDGLLEYIDVGGQGLSNQGWKDSGDAIGWIDGRLADPPIALAEVQGYAYRAALDAAGLFDVLGVGGGEELRRFAQRLSEAFHRRYWLSDARGPYIAVALDGDKRPVDSVTSNPGHLLATGLLTPDQETAVVGRLMSDLACPAGLRTLAPESARFNPISYHNGSIWPHDVAICARGMVLAGFPAEAAELLGGLLHATEAFGGRLPELYGYIDRVGVVPYPASCRPQAWSAAAAAVALWAATPVVPGVRGPTLLAPAPIADYVEVDSFTVAGRRFRTRHVLGSAEILGSSPT